MVLYINCCIRRGSRTERLAQAVLKKMGEYNEVFLPAEDIKPLNEKKLCKRTELLNAGELENSMFDRAHQFANAEKIVIAAPFWDGSFPSLLKVYIENIYAVGIVSRYSSDGTPVGMCSADELVYVTTSGGKYVPDFSYDYIKALAQGCFGIKNTRLVVAEMLDIAGMDSEKILRDAMENA